MSSLTVTDFKEYSKQIVGRFLQTIMVVDDRAYFTEIESTAKPAEVIVPGATSFSESTTADERDTLVVQEPMEVEEEQSLSTSSVDNAHKLDARKLIDDFASKRMVCAVIRPIEVELRSLSEKIYPLAETCDVVVFDWVLYGATDGGKVKELITEITRKSSREENRMRLIVVYTGQDNLAEIAEQISISLAAIGITDITTKDPYTLETGPVRISVYAKGNVRIAPENEELAARVISINEMPDRLIAEFSDMTLGLVSNVAIASMATLRSNTHRLLMRFQKDLDAPFLAHRAMLPQPDDANNLLVYLVGAELTAILDGAEVSRIADDFDGKDIIQSWLKMKENDGIKFEERFRPNIQNAALDDVLKIIRKGVSCEELEPQLKVFSNHPQKKGLTKRFADNPESSMMMDYRFAELTSIKSRYREGAPTLLSGTIVLNRTRRRGVETTSYWVCIQPICNCLRLKETTSFPFLPLRVIDDDTGKFDLVLFTSNNKYFRVKIDYTPSKLVMKRFSPSRDDLQRVTAQSDRQGYFFRASRGQRYYWVAELKSEHAQRIINQYAALFSRVGVDESEWLRRSG